MMYQPYWPARNSKPHDAVGLSHTFQATRRGFGLSHTFCFTMPRPDCYSFFYSFLPSLAQARCGKIPARFRFFSVATHLACLPAPPMFRIGKQNGPGYSCMHFLQDASKKILVYGRGQHFGLLLLMGENTMPTIKYPMCARDW